MQEVVLSADMQCEKCQKRVADIIDKMNGKRVCYYSALINLHVKNYPLRFVVKLRRHDCEIVDWV